VTQLIYLQDGALQLIESLFNGIQDFVKLDLSYCGLTSKYVLRLNNDLVYGIIELNLEGNPIMLEVCSLLIAKGILHSYTYMHVPTVGFFCK
jgi:hypothetical protein